MRTYLKTFWMWSIPLAWMLMEHITMKTQVRLAVPFLTGGWTQLGFYGFPLPYQHFSLVVSRSYNVYLLPLLLDFLVHLVVVAVLTYPFRGWIWRTPAPYRYGAFLFLWVGMLALAFINHFMDSPSLLPKYPVVGVLERTLSLGPPNPP